MLVIAMKLKPKLEEEPLHERNRMFHAEDYDDISNDFDSPAGLFDFQDIEGNTPPAQRPYQALSVSPGLHDGYFSVLIDGKTARTRLKLQPLEVPSLGLAVAIALEYDMQDKRKVEDITMPLTWLASVAIDRIPEQRKAVGQRGGGKGISGLARVKWMGIDAARSWRASLI